MAIDRYPIAPPPSGGGGDGGVPDDGSVTDAKVAPGAAINADKLADGTTNKILTATERTKLAGVASGATANSSDAQLRDRGTHTGTQAISTVTGLQTALDTKTAVSVDGVPVQSYNFDTDPVAPSDLTPPAYTQDETNAAIAAAAPGTFLGISGFDVGNIESLTRAPGFVDKSLGSGTLWVQYFTCPRTTSPIVRLGYPTRATAPSGVTLARMALFTASADGALVKVAQTASFTPSGTYSDQVNNFSTANGFPASYTCQVGQRYAIGLLVVATNAGTAHGWDIPGAGNKPVISARATGQTDIANTYTGTGGQLPGWYEGLYLFGRHATG